ncbi:bifunctional 3-demethylubiquinone-9 3-methyltransferase/ 2-octaprenyl-6-hydroxy phenol methylase [Kordia sp. SMS9]|uniref:class I SAM-dependent methyltransferase n=1 Tax=Kordia sp. SMS9 TaxID=2282170 RepID=UPI000E0CF957|nr:methyltransferase domain-containing protein [Kordia sp. SMS9]AXG69448.1 bifunctional 3-demethylubiquinone-9 3-methyltransferase/ 2-octaprenyl-6-hydroxy phenol methylase [Kordia sp. SMS9]
MKLDFSRITQQQDVYYLTPEDAGFSKSYLAVREKEKRILTDAEVRKLPYVARDEWPFRVKSTERFLTHIAEENDPMNILTIGCGNGWFSNKIAEVDTKHEVIGLDVNREELEQAARVFKRKNLRFVYADIFKVSEYFQRKFDIITLNGAIQYFEDFEGLIYLLATFLAIGGEIHIIDSPFYKTEEIEAAKERTKAYYTALGVPEMIENYHHHNEKLVQNFDVWYRYKKNILHKILGKKDSPFSWYVLNG